MGHRKTYFQNSQYRTPKKGSLIFAWFTLFNYFAFCLSKFVIILQKQPVFIFQYNLLLINYQCSSRLGSYIFFFVLNVLNYNKFNLTLLLSSKFLNLVMSFDPNLLHPLIPLTLISGFGNSMPRLQKSN